MSKKEKIVAWVFRQNFNESNLEDYCKKDRQNAIYVWIISFVLFFASLFFLVGTRSLFGQTVVDYTTSGTWSCPAGVTTVLVECWGGGGAGGGATGNPSAGGGGAGGSYSRRTVTVVPTTNYTVTVATAVSGTTGAGTTGNPSWFGNVSTVYAQGGQGGGLASSNSSNGTAGAGSTLLCIGDLVYVGGNGSDGIFTSGTTGGAGGGGAGSDGIGGNASSGTGGTGNSLNGGNGANGVADSNPGTSGFNYGGGGSGGKANGPQDRAGGAGAPGFVRITYGYCNPAPTSVDGSGITNITFGTVNNTTGTETNNYGDYSAQSASFSQGETVPIAITYQTGYTYDTKIWVDWNNDWDFNDVGEEVYSGTSGSSNPTVLSASFVIPVTASIGSHRMRIGGVDSGPPTVCWTGSYGSFEDYTLNVTAAVPMSFVSCTATQSNTSVITPGTSSQEIIGVQIVTSGVSSPLQASSFSFSTTGSSSTADLTNAKLWSTGSSNLFATTTQIGSTYINPDGTFTINSGANLPVSLTSGNNYFWLTYDISSTATIGNFIDAQFASVNVGTVEAPLDGSPSGNREIEIVYCTPTYSSGGSSDNITNVVLETLSDNPPANNSPYFFDRTTAQNDVPMLNAGQSYNLNVTFGSDGSQYSGVWIDFDLDGTFETSEFFSTGTNAGSGGTSIISINVPAGATIGETIMRIRGGDDSAVQNSHACGASASSFGQALDYKVSITSPVDMSYVSSNVTQLNTTIMSAGEQNQEMICLKIVCSGSLNPLELSDIVLRTDGTTSPLTDISNAKIWFTGTSSTFSTSSQFGATYANPPSGGTDMTISGTQVLNPGNNYLWLTYDIPAIATDGNFADAIVASFVLDGSSQTPSTTDPAGNRQIMQGCLFTLTLNDQYSDGWEGGTISVDVDGITVLSNVTLASGTNVSYQFVAETGDEIITTYVAGTNPSENLYIITNPNGAFVMMSGEEGSIPIGKTVNADCNKIDAFTSNNNAYQNDEAGFIITKNTTSQSGSVWNNFKIDLTQNFTIEFDIYMGNHEGADGIVFAMQGLCTSAGTNGSELGFGGISNSIGVEFDTYENGGWSDPVADHIAIISGGSVDHAAATNLDGPVDVSNLEDGAWRSVIIEWIYGDASSQTMRVSFGGTPQLTYTDDIITNYLGGSDETFWGFTGSTGDEYNLQKVRITSYPSNSTELTDITIDPGNTVNVEVADGANSYQWIPDDGSVSNPTAPNPVLSPTVTTEYTCKIEDGCGNIITNKFTVFVNTTLPVELENFFIICDNNQTTLKWNTLSEKNNRCFVVEKSYDAKNFYTVDSVDGKGNSNTEVRYVKNYQAENLPVYYRLKQIDFDGESSLSKTIYSNCIADHSEEIKVEIFPNPVADVLNIKANRPIFGNVVVEIFDLSGKIVFSQRINGGNEPFNARISTENLIPASYLVRITTDNEVLNYRIVKNVVFQ